MSLVLQFVGGVSILLPFALSQSGRLSPHAYAYLLLNCAGSGVLTAVAYLDGQWGFVIAQGVWTLAAAAGLVRRGRATRRGDPRPGHA